MTDALPRLSAALASQYRLERELGQGGMATVYLADDVKHGRKVAIKVLRPELAAVIGADRFLSEIKTTANLQHPHILPLFDSGEADSYLYYVMPYVQGESLRDRLARDTQLSVGDATRIATEVADALDYAHRHGVIHRDIKPENILLHDGRALVADFGIALAASKAGSRMTQTGMSLGTPSYMSPEQAMGERDIGARSDIYSLGAMTYEMLVGDPPFSGSTVQSIVAKVLTEKPIPPTRLRDTVPPAVERAVLIALQKLPADRFATAKEFADALTDARAAADRAPMYAATVATAATRPAPAGRWGYVLGAAGLLALLGAGWALTRRGAPTDGMLIRFALDFQPGVQIAMPITNPIAISPEGDVIAFSGRAGNGPAQIFVRPMADLGEHPLPGTEGGEQPCFSPDGKWIAFVANHQFKKIAVAGGAPTVLTDLSGLTYGCAWAPDGRIIISRGYRLEIVPDIGGAATPLLPADTAKGYLLLHPKLLDDGKRVIVTRWLGSSPTARLWTATIGKNGLTDLGVAGGSALGVLDGQLIYFTAAGMLMAAPFDASQGKITGSPVPVFEGIGGSSIAASRAALSRNGTLVYRAGDSRQRMVLVDLHGVERDTLGDRRAYSNPRFSPDGRRIAMSVDDRGTRDIWIYDLRSRTMSRATTEGSANDRPEWSSDGSRLMYRSSRGGAMAYWWQRSDGSGSAELLASLPDLQMWEAVATADGRSLVYRTGTTGSADIWMRGITGDTTPRALLNSPFTEWAGRPSPDTRWLAFESDESGDYQVYIRSLADGNRTHVSTDGGLEPIWSSDGKRLFYWQGHALMVATLATSPALSVLERKQLFIGDPPTTTGHANYDVSPDGQRVVLIRPAIDSVRTVVVHHWDQEMRSRLVRK